MWLNTGLGKVIISLPGVPYEMEDLMENEVIPKLQDTFPSEIIIHKTLLIAGIPETTLSQRLETFENELPHFIKLAYLPALSQIRLRLSCSGDNKQLLEGLIIEKTNQLHSILGQLVAGEDEDTLPVVIGRILKKNNYQLACAESCTGGFLSHLITLVPGSSQYFKGAIVSYANEMKEKSLGVNPVTIEKYGAVSEETVIENALENIKFKNHPDVMHLEATYLIAQKNFTKAEAILENVYSIVSQNGCIINTETEFLRTHMRIYKEKGKVI